MLDEKDAIELELHVALGLKDQLTEQARFPLHLVKPDQPSMSDQYETGMRILDDTIAQLTEKLEKIVSEDDTLDCK